MKLGIIVDRIRVDEKLVIKAADKLGVSLKIIDSLSLLLNLNNMEHDFTGIDVFLQRCISTLRGIYITKILEEYGINVVNDFQTSINCFDKIRCTLSLVKNDIPTPETTVVFSEKAGLETLKKLGYPAVIKPILGSWARLLAKINDEDAAKSVLEDRWEMGVWNRIFYIQKFINKPNRDIRTMVVGDKVIAAIYRVNEKDWRTNTARGGRAIKCKITSELEDLSIRAAEAVGGGILGVDIMESGDGFVVHEVNHSPEFKNVQRVTGVDVAKEIVEYLTEVGRR